MTQAENNLAALCQAQSEALKQTGWELEEAERERAESLEALWKIARILQGAVETLTPKEQAALARAKRALEEAD